MFKNYANQKQNLKSHVNSDTWLTGVDVCQMLRISKRTLANYKSRGMLPCSKVGGKIYFKYSDIQALLERHYIRSNF